MKGIRSEWTHHIVHNPWDKRAQETSARESRHFLGDGDEIASAHAVHQPACHCGCLNQPGGFCGQCHELICVHCLQRCMDCGKPLGPCCSVQHRGPDGEILLQCRQCHSSNRRQELVRGAARIFLFPFVRFRE